VAAAAAAMKGAEGHPETMDDGSMEERQGRERRRGSGMRGKSKRGEKKPLQGSLYT